ncbi:hypothetical protein [Caulobacter sp.]|uniref:hypothetical protein n=1 Tax=Caulobacter sp. TaxID=78 RepID=UPI001B232735|nr:hypothetical protein [Caulobacter sp.]MBO9545649.1 hypothetical protein [Caulobacter sp.]
MTHGSTLQIIQRWMMLEAERESLHTAWGDHESWLVAHYDWLNLTPEQQRAIPEAKRFDEIDRRFEEIGDEQAALFDALPEAPATDTVTVIASLSLAAAILLPEDYPGVHGLVTRAVRDLKLLARLP